MCMEIATYARRRKLLFCSFATNAIPQQKKENVHNVTIVRNLAKFV